jgi:pimeloyl-ACP methyl ester carboxylesterase
MMGALSSLLVSTMARISSGALVAAFAFLSASTPSGPPGAPASALSREAFNVGMLRVAHFGKAGAPPIIFIPALFCGGSQWQREIAALGDRYDIYALTLPGFDGRRRDTGGDLMNRAIADISALIENRHLDHPILVGHSLGGTLAILFAERHSREVRGVIAVDGGYPVAPTAQQRDAAVRQATAPYRGIGRRAFGDSLREHMLQYVITKKSAVDSVQAMASRSDPAAVVDWMSEALRLDLTPGLAQVTVPLTEIVPFDPDIDPHQGFPSRRAKDARYRAFLSHAPRGSLTMIDQSRHFVMIDQPRAFDRALYAAIDALAPPA